MTDLDDERYPRSRNKGAAKQRQKNRQQAPVALREAGIDFEMKNHGAHLIVDHGRVDFWPGTGLWHVRGGAQGTGVKKLIKLVRQRWELAVQPQAVICDYCGKHAHLVGGDVIYPHRPDLHAARFWRCAPCEAWVGCHPSARRNGGGVGDGTVPMGRLADQALRTARSRVHRVFDRLWDDGRTRMLAYHWLAAQMGIPAQQCHIGMFDLNQCSQALRICKEKLSYETTASERYGAGASGHPQLQQLHGPQAGEPPQPAQLAEDGRLPWE